MEKKYWVPALERSHKVINQISANPGKLKLTDLVEVTGINKSSMFVLLATMEQLGWVVKERDDTYLLGHFFAETGNAFLQQFDLVQLFYREVRQARDRLRAAFQLAKLEGRDVMYLAKEEAPGNIRLISEPGMKFPAYATALGKAMLAFLDAKEVAMIYQEEQLPALTPDTITDRLKLLDQLQGVKRAGHAFDLQEAVIGFCCVGSPVFDRQGNVIAAVSASIPADEWKGKRDAALHEVSKLAGMLSQLGRM